MQACLLLFESIVFNPPNFKDPLILKMLNNSMADSSHTFGNSKNKKIRNK